MVGIFAGRGDVIVAMVLAGLIGIWVGYNFRVYQEKFRQWKAKKAN